ncbi:MAG: sulfur carrier protein ThiS [Candidatus Thiosymbion ectosymbiont of Robbea hypermnestra]|nr:sulfur carrier protein ThiS [Candidatus Thiosymbion ectosymbiont of Robbea hypermnestra]
MQIILNDNPTEIPDGIDMAGLIERLELTGQRLAVEINEELVPRSRFREQHLTPGDKVEIIHAVGGG